MNQTEMRQRVIPGPLFESENQCSGPAAMEDSSDGRNSQVTTETAAGGAWNEVGGFLWCSLGFFLFRVTSNFREGKGAEKRSKQEKVA